MGKVGNDVKVLLEAQRLLLTSEMSKLTGEKAPDA
jgi:hypothetical protein